MMSVPPPPRLHIITDESGMHTAAPFMLIGGLWINGTATLSTLEADITAICQAHRYTGLVKWSNVCPRYLDCYKAIFDLYWDNDAIAFNSIAVNKARVNYRKYSNNDEVLGFYKFYYFLLKNRFTPGAYHYIVVDRRRVSSRRARLADLKACCNSAYLRDVNPNHSPVKSVQVLNIYQSVAMRLADLIIGSISASYEGALTKTAKLDMIDYIENKLRVRSLAEGTPLRLKGKYNNWEIKLS